MTLDSFLWAYTQQGVWHIMLNPFIVGLLLEVLVFLFILFFVTKKPKSSFTIFCIMVFDYVYTFFEDILWIEEKRWTKLYIITLFFIILTANLIGVVIEIIWVGIPFIHNYVAIPTSDINFNIAMAIMWAMIVIIEEFKFIWFDKALYNYFPILGKWYIPYERWNLPALLDWPIYIIIKIFDIIISMFLWILSVIWHFAKIISLSFRLFGNMTSGALLLWILLLWSAALTNYLVWFDFPVLFPIILHLQSLLVSLIQALVFPLLIAIFIKVAKTT